MNESLKINYEVISKKVASETITTFINGKNLNEAKDFAKKTIDDWRKEGKEDIIVDFKKWLGEKGLFIED